MTLPLGTGHNREGGGPADFVEGLDSPTEVFIWRRRRGGILLFLRRWHGRI